MKPLRSRRKDRPLPPREPQTGQPVDRLSGMRPSGEPAEVLLASGRSCVVFLTSGCVECRSLWGGLSSLTSPSTKLVVVTPSPSTESRRAVARLAPAGMEVLMSSEVWLRYDVRGAPWLLVVEHGTVIADTAVYGPAELAAVLGATSLEQAPSTSPRG